MVNVMKLKGRIVEEGFNIATLATSMGVNRSTLYRKLNGQCPITVDDADSIAKILQLSAADAYAIFFSQFVANTRQSETQASEKGA
ncbi:MAG: helix-turn-helix transcriptional regulator [Anaeromusa sp.]|uniref:helix-turn-helix transcriptional regulator n=1 Tax=Anaeromusa sp. TaxID=1872520 RepID=UPI002B21BBBE|nr:helix-turn-helix transcriptional regulator [Anaeromusa sp.]MEA4835156.1 helix-turn-helix transcriptional regulator [Anaeromusa sp.]